MVFLTSSDSLIVSIQTIVLRKLKYRYLFIHPFIHLFISYRGRGAGGEKHRYEREILTSCLPYLPQLGVDPAIQVCSLPGNRSSNLSVHRMALSQLSHSSWAKVKGFNLIWRFSFSKRKGSNIYPLKIDRSWAFLFSFNFLLGNIHFYNKEYY